MSRRKQITGVRTATETRPSDGRDTPRIVSTEDVLGGHPRIEGTRIGVLFVTERVEKAGLDPQTVADRHEVAVADVYRALAYYHEHPREMERVRRQREQAIERSRE